MEEYICSCCDYKTKAFYTFNRHCKSKYHVLNFKKIKFCDICKKEYKNISNFKRHYLSLHSQYSANCNILSEDNNDKKVLKKINKTTYDSNSNLINQVIEAKEDIKNEIVKSNIENKDYIEKSNKEVVAVVNKAITKASTLINYLMIHHSSTPPLIKITERKCSQILKLYNNTNNKPIDNKLFDNRSKDNSSEENSSDDEKSIEYDVEAILLSDYINKIFVKNISKSILHIVNHNKPKLQAIWNTDCARNHYVIKTEDDWNEDKAGIKFTEYIIKPLLSYIKDLIILYNTNFLKKKIVKTGKTPNQVKDDLLLFHHCLLFIDDLTNERFIIHILKELSPYLRYLSSELNLDDDNDDNDDKVDAEKIKELKIIQEDLIKIVKKK